MPGDWSREEVEAVVADYLDMLTAEIRNERYNKSRHRRQLARLLSNRSPGSIERKHQNISAVLIALDLPYIDGYKPLRNYQQLLFDVVEARVGRFPRLIEAVEEEQQRPITVPSMSDILKVLVDPPVPARESPPQPRVRDHRPVSRINYIARDADNAALGAAGEDFVVRFEAARLIAAGRGTLADKIERVSRTRGDFEGYDVLSFETTGRDRLIEVKTTSYGRETPFFVTRNELAVSRSRAGDYHLYRVFGFRRRARLFFKKGALDEQFALNPSQFLARPA